MGTANEREWTPMGKARSCAATVRVAAFEPRSLVNGPGVRAVLWVQGCGRRCPGCFNEGFQSREGGREVDVRDVLDWIGAAKGIEGVTFSGGEPLDQAEALGELACEVHAMGLGVVVFTGYEVWGAGCLPGTVRKALWCSGGMRASWRALLAETDLVVAGPYDRTRPMSHPLLASANQRLLYLTDRYRDRRLRGGRRVEYRIGVDGSVRTTGLPAQAGLEGNLAVRSQTSTPLCPAIRIMASAFAVGVEPDPPDAPKYAGSREWRDGLHAVRG